MYAHTLRHKLVHHNTYPYLNIVSWKKENNTTRDSHISSEFRRPISPNIYGIFFLAYKWNMYSEERDARFYIFVFPAALYVCLLAIYATASLCNAYAGV